VEAIRSVTPLVRVHCPQCEKNILHDEWVCTSVDPEDIVGDLPVSVFIFGGKNAPPEDGIYFINARHGAVTATVDEETTLELYCVNVCQCLSSHLHISLNLFIPGHAVH